MRKKTVTCSIIIISVVIFAGCIEPTSPPPTPTSSPTPTPTPTIAPTPTPTPTTTPEPANAQSAIEWSTSDQEGMQIAKSQNKPTMIFFYSDICPHSKEQWAVFGDAQVVNLSKEFVPIRGSGWLEGHYGIRYIPAIVFTDSQGEKIYRLVGYHDAPALIEEMLYALRLSTTLDATPTPTPTPSPSLAPTPSPLPTPSPTPTPTATPFPTLTEPCNITIEGDDDFQQKTKAALSLIEEKDPDAYELIRKYIGTIAPGNASGMKAYDNPPKYVVGERTYNSDTIWYAGTIAHDAYHSKLYDDYKMKNPDKNVPYDVWTGRDAEAQCINFQYNTLKKIGASNYTLNYVKNVIDSNFWEIPYDERDW
ncbi:MAG: hypothetical protein KAT65_18275 [Methanophagales archaeon]|nr:hypothetical protein [Methanophagales archaeon]